MKYDSTYYYKLFADGRLWILRRLFRLRIESSVEIYTENRKYFQSYAVTWYFKNPAIKKNCSNVEGESLGVKN